VARGRRPLDAYCDFLDIEIPVVLFEAAVLRLVLSRWRRRLPSRDVRRVLAPARQPHRRRGRGRQQPRGGGLDCVSVRGKGGGGEGREGAAGSGGGGGAGGVRCGGAQGVSTVRGAPRRWRRRRRRRGISPAHGQGRRGKRCGQYWGRVSRSDSDVSNWAAAHLDTRDARRRRRLQHQSEADVLPHWMTGLNICANAGVGFDRLFFELHFADGDSDQRFGFVLGKC